MKASVKRQFDRRDFAKTIGAAAFGIGAAASLVTDDTLEAITQNVKTASKPSELKITDLRVAVVVKAPMTCPLIRIDTNQGSRATARCATARRKRMR